MNFFQRLCEKFVSFAEFFITCALGVLLGSAYIVRYFRNPNPKISRILLIAFGAKIGKGTTLKRAIYFDNVYEDMNSKQNFKNLKIGPNCYIGDCVYFDLSSEILIENDVVVSGHAKFITHQDCNRSPELSKIYPRQTAPIHIEQGSWIAFDASVLPGVRIKKNTVIGSKSLVMSDTEGSSLYIGIPATKIKSFR